MLDIFAQFKHKSDIFIIKHPFFLLFIWWFFKEFILLWHKINNDSSKSDMKRFYAYSYFYYFYFDKK